MVVASGFGAISSTETRAYVKVEGIRDISIFQPILAQNHSRKLNMRRHVISELDSEPGHTFKLTKGSQKNQKDLNLNFRFKFRFKSISLSQSPDLTS